MPETSVTHTAEDQNPFNFRVITAPIMPRLPLAIRHLIRSFSSDRRPRTVRWMPAPTGLESGSQRRFHALPVVFVRPAAGASEWGLVAAMRPARVGRPTLRAPQAYR